MNANTTALIDDAARMAVAWFRAARSEDAEPISNDQAVEIENRIRELVREDGENCPSQAAQELAMFAVETACDAYGGGWTYNSHGDPRYSFNL